MVGTYNIIKFWNDPRDFGAALTFSPLALLMALSGRSTLKTRRIFTTEIAEDLKQTHKNMISLQSPSLCKINPERSFFYLEQCANSGDVRSAQCRCLTSAVRTRRYVLNAEGDQRHADDQQVQKVEVVSTECPFM